MFIPGNLLHFGYDLKIYNNIMVKEIDIANFSYIFEWQKHIRKKNLVKMQIGNTKK
jgi:hypothetical protein